MESRFFIVQGVIVTAYTWAFVPVTKLYLHHDLMSGIHYYLSQGRFKLINRYRANCSNCDSLGFHHEIYGFLL
jgi:hypothetical protein